MSLAYKMMESPVGKLKLVASDKGLVAIPWENDSPSRVRLGRDWLRMSGILFLLRRNGS